MTKLEIILGVAIMVNLIHLGVNKAKLEQVLEELKKLHELVNDSREALEEYMDDYMKEWEEKNEGKII